MLDVSADYLLGLSGILLLLGNGRQISEDVKEALFLLQELNEAG